MASWNTLLLVIVFVELCIGWMYNQSICIALNMRTSVGDDTSGTRSALLHPTENFVNIVLSIFTQTAISSRIDLYITQRLLCSARVEGAQRRSHALRIFNRWGMRAIIAQVLGSISRLRLSRCFFLPPTKHVSRPSWSLSCLIVYSHVSIAFSSRIYLRRRYYLIDTFRSRLHSEISQQNCRCWGFTESLRVHGE